LFSNDQAYGSPRKCDWGKLKDKMIITGKETELAGERVTYRPKEREAGGM
jgi:hypothetical protein